MDAIVYTSNAGHTRAYAEIMAEKTGLIAYSLEEAEEKLDKDYQIIYLGWLMAGSIKGFKTANSKFEVKAVCPVGMTAAGVDETMLREKNSIPFDIQVFYLQGGFEMDKLHGIYKLMMQIMRASIKKNLKKMPFTTDEDNEMIDMMTQGINMVNERKLDRFMDWYGNL